MSYSRFISLMKVILPLTALALLSTLFLVSNRISDSAASIPFAKVDLEQRAKEQRITAPFFSGKTQKGHLVMFMAEDAKPDADQPSTSLAHKMQARVDLKDGSSLSIKADRALIDNGTQEARLEGAVNISSSNGFDIRSDLLTSAMRSLHVVSPGTVTGDGPAGAFQAGALEIVTDDVSGKTTLFFTNGVKLIYTPTN